MTELNKKQDARNDTTIDAIVSREFDNDDPSYAVALPSRNARAETTISGGVLETAIGVNF
jgi:hypothetical protein